MNAIVDLKNADLAQRQPGGLSANDPFASARHIAWQGPEHMAVGQVVWQGSAHSTHFPHTELLIMCSGSVQVTGSETMRISAGEAVLITQGTTVRIEASASACWSFCAVSGTHTPASSPGILRIDFATPLKPSKPPLATVLLSSEPQCRSGGVYADDSTHTLVGVWDSTPYTRKQVPHRVNELMYLLAGSVTLTEASGAARTFNKGDILFVPKGTPCAWYSSVHVCKVYWVQE